MNRFLTAIVALALVAFFAIQSYNIIQSFSPPFTHHWATTDTPQVRVGEFLSLRYSFTRHRICQSELNRFIVRQSDNFVVWRERIPGGATFLGRAEVKNDTRVPDIPPGRYLFRVIAYADCRSGTFVIPAPDIAFEVKP